MQLFMRNISFATSEDDLYVAIAQAVHRPPIQPIDQPPINFHIRLFRGKFRNRHGAHSGRGLVTFPCVSVGSTFLAIHSSLLVQGRLVDFQPSNRAPDQARIQRVLTTPWTDPESVRRERDGMRCNSSKVPLSSLSFGRKCSDGVFSPEVTYEGGSVRCDLEARRLIFSLALAEANSASPLTPRPTQARRLASQMFGEEFDWDSLLGTLNFQDLRIGESVAPTVYFWYPPSRIISVARNSSLSEHSVLIESELPPTFYSEKNAVDIHGNPIRIQERMSSHDPSNILPPVIRTARLTFDTFVNAETFCQRSRLLHLPAVHDDSFTSLSRNLYSIDNKEAIHDFLQSLPFRLAFEVDKSTRSGLFSPVDILKLFPAILDLAAQYPQENDAIFRFFVDTMPSSDSSTVQPAPPPPRHANEPLSRSARRNRRRRERRRQRRLAEAEVKLSMDLPDIMDRAVTSYLQFITQSRQRYAPAPEIYESYHAIVTPTGEILEGPLPDQSNALLRRFGSYDRFLRVSFQDEERCKLRKEQDMSIAELLKARFKLIFTNGLTVAGRHYEWLGYSMSGLKEHTFWFVNSPVIFEGRDLDAHGIRSLLGDFSKIERKPALLGARWAQAFSTSMPSVTLEENELCSIPDIFAQGAEVGRTNSVFTDGCSPISSALARAIWKKVKRSRTQWRPSCFQFRIGGAKGVIVEDPTLGATRKVLCLRPSQTKFVADGVRTLDITTTSTKPMLCFLNRPLITILEHHGVSRDRFHYLQDGAISAVEKILKSTEDAATLFSQYGLGNSFRLPALFNHVVRVLDHQISDSINMARPVFHHRLLSKCLVFGANYILRDIKHRAHILIPGSYTLIGVADEWDCLDEGEIYAHIVDEKRDVNFYVEGRTLVTRSPQIHPGDVQFCQAVRDRMPLSHSTNVVVFSCRGPRSLPSMLGGGDLDGDIYNLILDRTLYPPKDEIGEAGEYQGLPHKETPNPCTIADVADFVTDFIQSDLLGFISILFLRIADLNGVDHPDCLLLASKASQAVDYSKVGHPVSMQELPRPPSDRLRPDFLSGEGGDPSSDRFYLSTKVLGELFRNVPALKQRVEHADEQVGDQILDAIDDLDLESQGLLFGSPGDDENLTDEMQGIFEAYAQQLLTIAKTHTTSKKPEVHLSEAELVSGTIQERYTDHKRRREAVKAMNLQTQELVNRIHKEFSAPLEDDHQEDEDVNDNVSDEEEMDNDRNSVIFRRAWAAFVVAEDALEDDPKKFGASSFGVIALSAMLSIAKAVLSLSNQTRYV